MIDGFFDTQGWNGYAFVRNNPVVYSDPSGNRTAEGYPETFSDLNNDLLSGKQYPLPLIKGGNNNVEPEISDANVPKQDNTKAQKKIESNLQKNNEKSPTNNDRYYSSDELRSMINNEPLYVPQGMPIISYDGKPQQPSSSMIRDYLSDKAQRNLASTMIAFSPAGPAKSVLDLIADKDILTGEPLTNFDRAMAAIPFIGKIKTLGKIGKFAKRSVFKNFDDIVSNPKSLYGKSAEEVKTILGEGWTQSSYGKTGTGWKFIKDDKMIFYHEGGRHVGSYYGFSSGSTGKVKIVGPDYKPLQGDKAKIIDFFKD